MVYEEKYYLILVNYNGFLDTIECLKSISTSSYKNIQVVIVDNHSSNDSLNRLRTYFSENNKDYIFYESTSIIDKKLSEEENRLINPIILISAVDNRGFAAGNNIGISYAELKKDYSGVILLNNDTIVERDTFENLISQKNVLGSDALYSGKILYYSTPNIIWFNGGKIDYVLGRPKHLDYDKKDYAFQEIIRKVNFITFCYVLIPKEVISKIGLLDESYFMYFEDTDYCYKASQRGCSLYIVQNSLIYHKVGRSGGGKYSPFLFYWYYRNFVLFNRRRQDYLKIISQFIVLFSRPVIFLKIFFHNRKNARIMMKATFDGFLVNIK